MIPTARQAINPAAGLKSGGGNTPTPAVAESNVPNIEAGTGQNPVPSIYIKQLQTPQGPVSVQFAGGRPTAIIRNQTFSQPINQSSNGFNLVGSAQETYALSGKSLQPTVISTQGSVVYNGVHVADFSGPTAQFSAVPGATVQQPVTSGGQNLGTVNLVPQITNGQLSLAYSSFTPATYYVTQNIGGHGFTYPVTTSYNPTTNTVSAGPTQQVVNLQNAVLARNTTTTTSLGESLVQNYALNSAFGALSGLSGAKTYISPGTAIGTALVEQASGNVIGGVVGLGAATVYQAPTSQGSAFSAVTSSGFSNKPIDLLTQSNIQGPQQTVLSLVGKPQSLTLQGLTQSKQTGLSLQSGATTSQTISSPNITTSNAKTVSNSFVTDILGIHNFLDYFTVKTTESRPPATNLSGFIGGPGVNIFTSEPTTFTTSVKANNPAQSSYNYNITNTVPTTGLENVFHIQEYIESQQNNPKGPQGNPLLNYGLNIATSFGNLGANLYSPTSTTGQRLTAAGTVGVIALAAPLQLGISGYVAGIPFGTSLAEASEAGVKVSTGASLTAAAPTGAFGNVAFTQGASILSTGRPAGIGQTITAAGTGFVLGPIFEGVAGEALSGFEGTRQGISDYITGSATKSDIAAATKGGASVFVSQKITQLGEGEVVAKSSPTGYSVLQKSGQVNLKGFQQPVATSGYPIEPTSASPAYTITTGTGNKPYTVELNPNLGLGLQEAAYRSAASEILPGLNKELYPGTYQSAYGITYARLPTQTAQINSNFLAVFEPTEKGTQAFISGGVTQGGDVSGEQATRGFMNQGQGSATLTISKPSALRTALGLGPKTTDIELGGFTVKPATAETGAFGRTNVFTRPISAGDRAVIFDTDKFTGTSLHLEKATKALSVQGTKQVGQSIEESGLTNRVTVLSETAEAPPGGAAPAGPKAGATLFEGRGGTFTEQVTAPGITTSPLETSTLLKGVTTAAKQSTSVSGQIGLVFAPGAAITATPQGQQASIYAPSQVIPSGTSTRQEIRTDPLLTSLGGVLTTSAERYLYKQQGTTTATQGRSGFGTSALSSQLQQATSNPYQPGYAAQTSRVPSTAPAQPQLPGQALPGTIEVTRVAPTQTGHKDRTQEKIGINIVPTLGNFRLSTHYFSEDLINAGSQIFKTPQINTRLQQNGPREQYKNGLYNQLKNPNIISNPPVNQFRIINTTIQKQGQPQVLKQQTQQVQVQPTGSVSPPGFEFGVPIGSSALFGGARRPKPTKVQKSEPKAIPKFGYVSDITHATLGLHGTKLGRKLAKAGEGLSRPLL